MFDNVDLHIITNLFIMTMLVITALTVAFSRNLIVSTIALSIFSLLMALIYVILNAPDVAITEAAIGAGISTILFIATLILTGEIEKPKPYNILTIVLFGITGAALLYAVVELPSWGDPEAPTNQHVAPYYISQTASDIGIPNIVTAILASYRGFDTMGEVVVVFTACIIIYTLLHGKVLSRKTTRD